MSSQRRIESNRANGKKSKGPVTPKGKQKSSRNGIRHGLLAATVVLEGENLLLFRRLLRDFTKHFQPRDTIEAALVETMAAARWRQIRIMAMEKSSLEYQIKRQDEPVN